MTFVEAVGAAKVNLSLEVFAPDASGLHPLRSLVETVSWWDRISVTTAAVDALSIDGPLDPAPDNLVWRAVEWHRRAGGAAVPVAIDLAKRIPVAAGLAGGSADAAATIVALDRLTGTPADRAGLGDLGADVPFALHGGAAVMEGYGERLTPRRGGAYALVIAVPDIELSTPAVYSRWDELDGPAGPVLDRGALPPSVRDLGPLRNDLYPAAVSLAPELADRAAFLADLWSRPISMSGSGPSLFAYFADLDEAESAAGAEVLPGFRAVRAVVPLPDGARLATDDDR